MKIKLTQNKQAIISDQDWPRVRKYKWQAHRDAHKASNLWYAQTTMYRFGKRKCVKLHRFILGLANPNIEIDHRNRNGLDNRRGNLRIANRTENMGNRKLNGNNTSGFKGVHGHVGKWRARISRKGKRIHLGLFKNKKDAAAAYNAAALAWFGDFARINSI